jgi:hypothetical protein
VCIIRVWKIGTREFLKTCELSILRAQLTQDLCRSRINSIGLGQMITKAVGNDPDIEEIGVGAVNVRRCSRMPSRWARRQYVIRGL